MFHLEDSDLVNDLNRIYEEHKQSKSDMFNKSILPDLDKLDLQV